MKVYDCKWKGKLKQIIIKEVYPTIPDDFFLNLYTESDLYEFKHNNGFDIISEVNPEKLSKGVRKLI